MKASDEALANAVHDAADTLNARTREAGDAGLKVEIRLTPMEIIGRPYTDYVQPKVSRVVNPSRLTEAGR